jgi:heme-degrading monooxygenase HmoA
MISEEDFKEWQHNEVTKELHSYLKASEEDLKEILVTSAGSDSKLDLHMVALISCFREILSWKPESLEQEE